MTTQAERIDRLIAICEEILPAIGKEELLADWLEEGYLYYGTDKEEAHWEDRSKDAQAAQATHGLSAEQRMEYEKMVQGLVATFVKLTYKSGDASCMFWDETAEDSEYYADPAYYWCKEIEFLEAKIARMAAHED